MLKHKVVMLLIMKKLKRNQKSLLRMQSTLRRISLPTSMAMRENLGCRNQCLFLVRNTSKEEEHYNRFCEWMRPLFLEIPFTDAIKMPPYSKYLKDIVTNKRKIPSEEISTLLAN
jgi:hypothetical protein